MKHSFAGLLAVLLAVLLMPGSLSAATLPMDSARGDRLFQTQGCVQCHRLKGVGGQTAPDLGRVLDRAYTPALLAGTMWNHAPTMWTAIRQQDMKVGDLDRQGAGDLFASFYAARYFESAGDAARGKRLFITKSCARCHGLLTSPNPQAKPVSQWHGLSDPVDLVGAMWNHSPAMWSELSQRKISWPGMTPQDLTDLLVFLRTDISVKAPDPTFQITAGEEGEKLFTQKGCVDCHNAQHLSKTNLTLTGVAAAMWNHADFLNKDPSRKEPPRLTPDEMREMLSAYWARQFFQEAGDASRGKRLFASKHCVDCHAGSGPAPALPVQGGAYNGMTMVSALWRHGPEMLTDMRQKHIEWPVFRAADMADLIAWLNQGAKKP